MEPAWAQFESTNQNKLYIVTVNVDEKSTPEFQKYSHLMGQAIPATIWLTKEGKTLSTVTGALSVQELQTQTNNALGGSQ